MFDDRDLHLISFHGGFTAITSRVFYTNRAFLWPGQIPIHSVGFPTYRKPLCVFTLITRNAAKHAILFAPGVSERSSSAKLSLKTIVRHHHNHRRPPSCDNNYCNDPPPSSSRSIFTVLILTIAIKTVESFNANIAWQHYSATGQQMQCRPPRGAWSANC